MTILEYIQKQLKGVRLTADEAEVKILLKDANLAPSALLESPADLVSAKKIIVKFIPKLLAMPNITEGGMSVSFDRQAVIDYYNFMCNDIGVDPIIIGSPRVRDRSNYW